MTTNAEPTFWTVEKARHIVDPPIPLRTFYHWRRTGKFRTFRPGRELLVDIEELRRFIRSHGPASQGAECDECKERRHDVTHMKARLRAATTRIGDLEHAQKVTKERLLEAHATLREFDDRAFRRLNEHVARLERRLEKMDRKRQYWMKLYRALAKKVTSE